MVVHRHGPLAGPECPWCPAQMHKCGSDNGTDYYECRNGHHLSIDNDLEPDDDEEDW